MNVCTGRYSTGADRKFALLEDLFKKFPSMPVSVEIKENNRELIEKVKISNLFQLHIYCSAKNLTIVATFPENVLSLCVVTFSFARLRTHLPVPAVLTVLCQTRGRHSRRETANRDIEVNTRTRGVRRESSRETMQAYMHL